MERKDGIQLLQRAATDVVQITLAFEMHQLFSNIMKSMSPSTIIHALLPSKCARVYVSLVRNARLVLLSSVYESYSVFLLNTESTCK